MKKLVHSVTGEVLEVGADAPLPFNTGCKIVAILPPSPSLPVGRVVLDNGISENIVSPAALGQGWNWREVRYSTFNKERRVGFNTAAHTFKFDLKERVVAVEHPTLQGKVVARFYGADNGDPYYQVRWHMRGLPGGYTVERAKTLERDYTSGGMVRPDEVETD